RMIGYFAHHEAAQHLRQWIANSALQSTLRAPFGSRVVLLPIFRGHLRDHASLHPVFALPPNVLVVQGISLIVIVLAFDATVVVRGGTARHGNLPTSPEAYVPVLAARQWRHV